MLSASAMRSIVVGFGFRAIPEADVREAGLSYARKRLTEVVRPEALERIEWHKAQGDVVVVVSASLDAYLSDWCERLGLELICTHSSRHGTEY